MNNPFLSDRNIFSKVINPIKKKSQTQKKQQPKKQQSYAKPSQGNRQSFVTTYNYHKQEKGIENQYSKQPLVEHKMTPPQKMTFGVPNQESNNYIENPNIKNTVKQTYNNAQFHYKLSAQFNQKPNKVLNNAYQQNRAKQKPRVNFQENTSITSANHQDFPKAYNFDNYSPIIPKQSPKLNQSQFINIEALGEDLNRFLAESKNQDEICRILGIEKKPKKKIVENRTFNEAKRQPQAQKTHQNMSYEPNNHYQKPVVNPFTKPSLNYQKQKVHQSSSNNNVFESFKPKPRPQHQFQKSSKDYIPTFNYVGVQNQTLTESRQQQILPTFNKISQKQPSNRHPQVLDYEPLDPQQNLEVFNYSKVNNQRQEASLQEIINKQMMNLALSGKYRTFLTSSQKLVMVSYKAEHL